MKDRLEKFYRNRFKHTDYKTREKVWKILCKSVFQSYIKPNDTVMDIGAGFCEFINNINCANKIAVDLNRNATEFAKKGIRVLNSDFEKIPSSYYEKIDVVFVSNFLEHLESKKRVMKLLEKTFQLLKNNGRLMILQPNINLVKEAYWDFVDHNIVLNDKSLEEALSASGFKVEKMIVRFLPYTTKTKFLNFAPHLLRFYLIIPPRIRPLAGQTFAVAKKVVK